MSFDVLAGKARISKQKLEKCKLSLLLLKNFHAQFNILISGQQIQGEIIWKKMKNKLCLFYKCKKPANHLPANEILQVIRKALLNFITLSLYSRKSNVGVMSQLDFESDLFVSNEAWSTKLF